MTPEDATLHYDSVIREADPSAGGHEHVSEKYPNGQYGQLDANGVTYPQAGLAHMHYHPIDPRFLFLSPDLCDQLQTSKMFASPSDPAITRYNNYDIANGKYNGMGATEWTSRTKAGKPGRLLHQRICHELRGVPRGR